jgi:hypothetical protein
MVKKEAMKLHGDFGIFANKNNFLAFFGGGTKKQDRYM